MTTHDMLVFFNFSISVRYCSMIIFKKLKLVVPARDWHSGRGSKYLILFTRPLNGPKISQNGKIDQKCKFF